MQTSPLGRARLDARVAGFVAAPMPSPRRASARPTRTIANGFFEDGCKHPPWVEHGSTPASLDAPQRPCHRRVERVLDPREPSRTDSSRMDANIPRGSSTARRPRRWSRRSAHAIAASSECSTHENHRERILRGWMQTSPVGRARLDARVAGFAVAPMPSPRRASARPTRTIANGFFGDGDNRGLTVATKMLKSTSFAMRSVRRSRGIGALLGADPDAPRALFVRSFRFRGPRASLR